MSRARTPQQSVGFWQIEQISLSDVKTSFSLTESKEVLKTKLPLTEFTRAAYPYIAEDLIGTSIPVGYGKNQGAWAYPINPLTKRFKWIGHSVLTADAFYDESVVPFTPDSVNLSTGEFTYSAWDGETELYVDYTADSANPVDLAKVLLTDTVRGGSLPLSSLDTTSTKKGFGSTGARTCYIWGTDPNTGAETPLYPLGFHVKEPTEIKALLSKIQESCFGFIFRDFRGLWQFKPWRPVPSDGLTTITEDNIVGELKPTISVADSATKVIAKWLVNEATNSAQRMVKSSEELRQLRNLLAHKTLERTLPITARHGADTWASKALYSWGNPRRVYKFRATSELKLHEPGDYIRLIYGPKNIDVIVLLTSVTKRPGDITVDVEAVYNYGFGDRVGYWTGAPPLSYPSTIGGSFTNWSSTGTDEIKQNHVRRNWAVWANDNGYASETTPDLGYKVTVWW